MENVLSLFSFYDFLGYLISGAAVICGVAWAFGGVPENEPGATGVFALLVASYAIGHAIAALANVWESSYWQHRGGWPSVRRLAAGSTAAYDDATLRAIDKQLEALSPGIAGLPIAARFAAARALLRAAQRDGRAELMNAQYGLNRGLATAVAVVLLGLALSPLAGHDSERLFFAAPIGLLLLALYIRRFDRYGYRFADQVWHDFLVLPEPTPARR